MTFKGQPKKRGGRSLEALSCMCVLCWRSVEMCKLRGNSAEPEECRKGYARVEGAFRNAGILRGSNLWRIPILDRHSFIWYCVSIVSCLLYFLTGITTVSPYNDEILMILAC